MNTNNSQDDGGGGIDTSDQLKCICFFVVVTIGALYSIVMQMRV